MSDGHTAGWLAAEKAADVTLEVPGGGPMFFRRVPAGEFWMGSRDPHPEAESWTHNELPRHRVVVERESWMATFPVTQRQFDAFARAVGLTHAHRFAGNLQRPAENVDWHEATRFCAWLGEQAGWSAGRPALPSEAHWEHACRALTDTDYCSGDGPAALAEVGWFDGNSERRTHDVGEKQPNAWGIYDMHGNVWEWCRDAWRKTPYRDRVDGDHVLDVGTERQVGEPEDSQAFRVVRGGSWLDSAGRCRSARRFWWGPGDRIGVQGFRVCLLPGPSGQAG